MYEDFEPSTDWRHDSIVHMLTVDLPGFKNEDLKLQLDKNRITASGERQVAEGKYKRFKHSFTVPEDSNTDKITARIDHGILFINMPKNIENKPEKEVPMASTTHAETSNKKEEIPSFNGVFHDWVITTALVAFTIGFYVSRNLSRSSG